MLFSAGTKYFGIFAAVKQFFKIIEHFFLCLILVLVLFIIIRTLKFNDILRFLPNILSAILQIFNNHASGKINRHYK